MDVSKQKHKTHDVFYTEALSSYKTHLFKAQKERVPVSCCRKHFQGSALRPRTSHGPFSQPAPERQKGMVHPSKWEWLGGSRLSQEFPVWGHKAQDCFVLSCGPDLCLRAGGWEGTHIKYCHCNTEWTSWFCQEHKLSWLPLPGSMSGQACGEGLPSLVDKEKSSFCGWMSSPESWYINWGFRKRF